MQHLAGLILEAGPEEVGAKARWLARSFRGCFQSSLVWAAMAGVRAAVSFIGYSGEDRWLGCSCLRCETTCGCGSYSAQSAGFAP